MEKKCLKVAHFFIAALLLFTLGAYAGDKDMKKAVFAGGCFWCMEPPYVQIDGVTDVIVGYTGGKRSDPTYEDVSTGRTGHVEAILVNYDPQKADYQKLLDVFWRSIDPTDPGGQFADRGTQYKTAIYYFDEEQRSIAEGFKKALENSGKFSEPITTEIIEAGEFYPAEEYHQEYYKKNPLAYNSYKVGSGRDGFLKRFWEGNKNVKAEVENEKLPKKELKEILTPLQYKVTQQNGTERPFNNEYWNNSEQGIYVDIVSGEALFSSEDKFTSGTGWPSFTKSIEKDNIVEKEDRSIFQTRTEVRSRGADSHLGHVFNDGPNPTGLRYCINSAALRFISRKDLEEEGYGEYVGSFKK